MQPSKVSVTPLSEMRTYYSRL